MPENGWPAEELAEALSSILSTGGPITVVDEGDCTVVGVTARGDDILFTFRWMSYPHTLGLAIGTDGQYGDIQTPAEWASDATVWLQEELGTGRIVGAARHQHDGIIELGARSWPDDRRFYGSSVGPSDEYAWDSIEYFERDGFDTTLVRALRADDTLVSWSAHTSIIETAPRSLATPP